MSEDLIYCGDLRYFKNEKERHRNQLRFVGALVPFEGERFWLGDAVRRIRINELTSFNREFFYVFDAKPQNVIKLLLEAGVDLKRIRVGEYCDHDDELSDVSAFATTGERVLVFGAGACGEDFVQRFRQHYQIVGILDNDPGKWGMELVGINVLNPDNVNKVKWDRLVICSQFWREIDAQLQSTYGIKSNQIEVWTVTHHSNAGSGNEKAAWVLQIEKILEKKVVLNGPFKDMKYPDLRSFGSALYPKLLGSYEYEIQEVVEQICRNHYSSIVDIGCAEGYYAVGFGMRQKEAKVFVFDTDIEALEACKRMGDLNDVAIQAGGFCDQKRLLDLELGDRALIVSDCEGYERELFNKFVAQELRQHDLLIETHDFIRIDITQGILEAFAETHDIEIFESKDDILKAYHYDFVELKDFELQDKFNVLAEWRESIIRWVFLRAKMKLR